MKPLRSARLGKSALLALFAFLTALFLAGETPQITTPPVDHELLPNAYQVSPVLYRGAQPKKGGFPVLKDMGIKTVVSLRSFHGEGDRVREAGMEYIRFTVKPWHVEDKEVRGFLKILRDPEKTPVFLHCKRGADRTGLFVALYRVSEQGWSKADARQEMVAEPYGYHRIWAGLLDYLDEFEPAAFAAEEEEAPQTQPAQSAGQKD